MGDNGDNTSGPAPLGLRGPYAMPENLNLPDMPEFSPHTLTYLLVIVAVVGLALCLVGRKLARGLCMLAGLAGGGGAAYAIMAGGSREMLFIGVAIGAVAGLVAAWLLFRVCMGLALATVLGLAAPAIGLALQGNLPPLIPDSARALVRDVAETAEQAAKRDVDVEQTDPEDLVGRLRAIVDDEVEAAGGWWKGMGRGGRYTTIFAAAAGALVGMVIGLVAPEMTAAIISSFLGALLIVTSLCGVDVPRIEAFVPQTVTTRLTAIGLITAAGWALQWIVFRRKADK